MLSVFKLIAIIAPTTSTVLITGESGTGKELAARAIHFHSLRRDRPFVAVNCGALTETLLESELFGHMRGAFTGADATARASSRSPTRHHLPRRDQRDEPGDAGQAAAGCSRSGASAGSVARGDRGRHPGDRGHQPRPRQGRGRGPVREDLFYRINVIPLTLPPLRERREDIPLLAAHFVQKFAPQMGKKVTGLSATRLRASRFYEWPGNIRELENAMERAVALEQTPTILPESLPEAVRGRPCRRCGSCRRTPALRRCPCCPTRASTSSDTSSRSSATTSRRPSSDSNGVKMRAAEMLGMSFRSFRYYTRNTGWGDVGLWA